MKHPLKRPPGTLNLGWVVNGQGPVFMTPEQRAMHLYIAGSTGTGKSKLLESLVRQTIYDQSKTKCGMILLDPHGKLYDDIMRWMATHRLKRPVIPIDLRREDQAVAFNLLQRSKKTRPSVVVDNIVDAMAHVWGQAGTDQWPLFARWAGAIMHTLYEKNLSIYEAIYLTDRTKPELRQALTADIQDPVVAQHMDFANSITGLQLDQQFSSSINRFERFLRSEHLRMIFGQSETSIDLGAALDEGHIILVSLSQQGGNISQENARLFGTLLLSKLWTAAQERGKPTKQPKPFYVFIDEFQRYITPTISENLDEARGYGLHMTMAHQFPGQLIKSGPIGERLFGSIMNNASSKIVFRLQHEEDLLPLAKWLYLGVIDPDQIKHELYSTKVLGHREEYREAYGFATHETEGGGSSTGSGSGSGLGQAIGAPTTVFDSEGNVLSMSHPDVPTRNWNSYFAKNQSDNTSWGSGTTKSVQKHVIQVPIMGQELSHVQFRDINEQIFRSMAVLFDQKQRQAVVRLVNMKAPVSMFAPWIKEGFANPERTKQFQEEQFGRWPFALSTEEAERRIEERRKRIEQLAPVRIEEPKRRRSLAPPRGTIEVILPKAMSLPLTVKVGNVELQERDLRLLAELFDCRFVTIPQSAALFFDGNHEVAKQRLRKLFEAEIISKEKLPVSWRDGSKVKYSFHKPTLDLLIEHGLLPRYSSKDWDSKLRKRFDVSESTMKHELAVIDVKAALQPAINALERFRVVEFGVWPLGYQFEYLHKGKPITLKPDGYLCIAEHLTVNEREFHHFYLEVDRGTEDLATLLDKAIGYRWHYTKGGFLKWLGRTEDPREKHPFRVMVITLTAQRRDNICEKYAELGIETQIWFTTFDEIMEDPLGLIWTFPKLFRETGGGGGIRKVRLLDDPSNPSDPSGPPGGVV